MPLLGTAIGFAFVRGDKFFELNNHLSNVLVTVNDKKLGVSSNNSTVDYFIPQIVSAQDYYSFGMLQLGRSYNAASHRYGFNGKENDNEVKGEGMQLDYGSRVYDPRLAKFLSMDPLTKKFPFYTPYQFAGNTPIWAIDMDGEESLIYTRSVDFEKGKHSRYGYEVYTGFEENTGSRVILMNRASNYKWYVLKNKSDDSYAQFFTDEPGNKMGQYVYWQKFKTGETIQLEKDYENLHYLFVGGILAPPAAVVSIPVYSFMSTYYIGRGFLNIAYDGAAQLAQNGGDFNKVNKTSLAASFVFQWGNWWSLGVKNTISNYGEYTNEKGWALKWDECHGLEDVFKRLKAPEPFIKSVAGTIVDKPFDALSSLPVANKAQLTRWTNLSYKSK